MKVIYIFSLILCCFLYFKKVTHNVVNRRSNVQYLKWYKINIIMDICKLLTDCCCRNKCTLLFKSNHYFRFWIPGSLADKYRLASRCVWVSLGLMSVLIMAPHLLLSPKLLITLSSELDTTRYVQRQTKILLLCIIYYT